MEAVLVKNEKSFATEDELVKEKMLSWIMEK